MTTRTPRTRPGEEVWETTTNGYVWVRKTDERGRTKLEKVGGKAGSRLRIKTLDREIAMEEAGESNPFVSGLLKRIDADQSEDPDTATEHALSTEELMVGFAKSGNAFRAFVDKLNEFNVRRMDSMAEGVDASASQISYLKEVIATKYRKGGDTPTYREMAERGDVAR